MEVRTDSADPKEIAVIQLKKDRPSYSVLPNRALRGVIHAFRNGVEKYGRLNWRDTGSCAASTYFDATMDHITAWWEGEDNASDSGLNHLDHAIACLLIIRDNQMANALDDDRPLPLEEPASPTLPLQQQKTYDNIYYEKIA